MPIGLEEVTQTIINLLLRAERAEERVKELEQLIASKETADKSPPPPTHD